MAAAGVKKARAVVLLSGGLDSTLAVLVLQELGVEVTAVTFLTHFGCDLSDRSSCSHDPFPAARQFGFEIRLCHLADQFIEMVKRPKFGYGKNANPCLDCRILMLREARVLMRMIGADFLATGEVLGQRPMSQRKGSFPLIDRQAGVEGLVVRPLSAKSLPPTRPELSGLIDRADLYAFAGRSRRPQMALAARLGLTDYPNPAGGCLLTDPNYAGLLKDLLRHDPGFGPRELRLLRAGRNFRLSERVKLIVGRNQAENEAIRSAASPADVLLEVTGVGSPTTILTGPAGEDDLALAAAITARYSDAGRRPLVEVTVSGPAGSYRRITTAPAGQAAIDRRRIRTERH